MYLPIIECYMIIFLFIESYVIQRVAELEMDVTLGYFEMVENLEVDCSSKQEEFTLLAFSENEDCSTSEVSGPAIVPTISVLDDGALELMNSLEQEVMELNQGDNLDNQEDYYVYSDADCPPELDGQNDESQWVKLNSVEEEEDYLSMSDLNGENSDQQLNIDSYSQFSTSKISDNMEGLQQWTVKVVGMEDAYIHVSDGQRIWLNVGIEKARKITNNDILAIDVMKNGKEVEVLRIIKLESGVNEDYLIPDEESYFGVEDSKVAM
ncbi:hypothetical protein [Bacillus sp. AFS040349]|uniref:hypothetical protein n=1 Tax=Bacillus sp. AFS040349 TaxID=2033502 RepID=UPI000BFC97CE|nr:hypothetical protein [Bacillus sp. AFS040349]PGT83267.1 hypothetical protein COD11_13105 [Bacillus sp. AFS040349]